MDVVITIRFENPLEYESWLQSQAQAILLDRAAPIALEKPEPLPAGEDLSSPQQTVPFPTKGNDEVPGPSPTTAETLPETAPTPAPEKSRRARRPRKTAEQKRAEAAVKAAEQKRDAQEEPTTEQSVLPVAPAASEAAPAASEAAPAEGERVYTLSDSRDVLTTYLAKEGNGADSLLKELKVHNAKRINEVPSEHVHGFLKRMVEAS